MVEVLITDTKLNIDWEVISNRLGEGFNPAEISCVEISMAIRDYLESDLAINPETLYFKSVKGRRGTLQHVWVEHDGAVVDTPFFEERYKQIYPLGKKDAEYEEQYIASKEAGLHEELIAWEMRVTS